MENLIFSLVLVCGLASPPGELRFVFIRPSIVFGLRFRCFDYFRVCIGALTLTGLANAACLDLLVVFSRLPDRRPGICFGLVGVILEQFKGVKM